MASLASNISFQKLCSVYENIITSRGHNNKIEILKKFLEECRDLGRNLKKENCNSDVSLFPIMRLFLLKIDRERGPHGLKQHTLGKLYLRVFCIGKNTPDAQKIMNYKEPDAKQNNANDFAERIYWILKPRQSKSRGLNIEQINSVLDKIAAKNAANENRDSEFIYLCQHCDSLEIKWITRIILKDLRLGMGQKNIFDAYHLDAEHLFGEKSNLREVCEALSNPDIRLKRTISNITILQPFRPMLLERCAIGEITKLFRQPCQYVVQSKYDGERSQLHMKNGQFKYYTRHGVDITSNESYGSSANSSGFLTKQVSSLLNPNCHSIILDGELLVYRKKVNKLSIKAMPYDVKKLKLSSECHPCFIAFDILYYNDQILLDKPLQERLQILKTAFTDKDGILMHSKNEIMSSTDEIIERFNESLDNKEEGIVIKKIDAPYKLNTREGSNCYKIKAEYSKDLITDIDMIIVGGYHGEGKHAGIFNSFLMAVAERGENEPKKFFSVVAVGSGLSNSELSVLNGQLKPHWTRQMPEIVVGPRSDLPAVWIHPKNSIILQLRATSVVKSRDQPVGYTLYFPRVIKIRQDKPWQDTCTIIEFKMLAEPDNFANPLIKRHATSEDLFDVFEDVPSTKRRKVRATGAIASIKVDEKNLGVRAATVSRISRLFQGKEFCVINGEENLAKLNKLTKADIERLLLSHGAKIVQNPRKETFCVITGNPSSARLQNLVNGGKYNVAILDWLLRATKKENWGAIEDWKPWELLSFHPTTVDRLTEKFDDFYDSFTEDADTNSLERSIKRLQEHLTRVDVRQQNLKKLKLFPSGISPFSLFSNISGYFLDPHDIHKHKFEFMRGTESHEITVDVNYIFVNDLNVSLIDIYGKINECENTLIKIINSEWIKDCFFAQKLLPTTKYLVH